MTRKNIGVANNEGVQFGRGSVKMYGGMDTVHWTWALSLPLPPPLENRIFWSFSCFFRVKHESRGCVLSL